MVAYLFRRLQTQERLRAIEKGLTLAFDPCEVASRTRRSGIVLTAAGAGIASADALVAWIEYSKHLLIGMALAFIPFAIGLGLLYDYWLQSKQLARK